MKRALLVSVLVAATSTSAGTASANTYLGLGIGTSPAISGDNTENLDSSSRSAKLFIGMRMGNVSLEGGFGGSSLGRFNNEHTAFNPDYGDLYALSGALKLSLPLGNNFEGFGRAGLQHTMLRTADKFVDQDMSGNGILLGGGFEYRLNLGVGSGSIFVDYTIGRTGLTGDQNEKLERTMTTRTWMLGLTVGI